VPGRHVRATGECLDVQRLRVLPVDPVADAAQPREVAQVLRRGGSAGHLRYRATSHQSCLAPLASSTASSTRRGRRCAKAGWPLPILRGESVRLVRGVGDPQLSPEGALLSYGCLGG
jgi:hypothetical protein